MYKLVTINVLNLSPVDLVWGILFDIVDHTKGTFKRLKKIQDGEEFIRADMTLVYDKKRHIVAWGLVVQAINEEYPQLHIYTIPKYRRQGIQRDVLMPFYLKTIDEPVIIQATRKEQKETFKYFAQKDADYFSRDNSIEATNG